MRAVLFLLLGMSVISCAGVQTRYHEVATGETLVRIAQRYGLPVEELERHNRLVLATGLEPGKKLYVPFELHPEWNQDLRTVAKIDDDEAKPESPKVDQVPSAHFDWPVQGRLSSLFGRRKLAGEKERAHEGIDIAARKGTPVRSARSGHVIYASNRIRGYGNMVIVKHADNFTTVYAHLSKFGKSIRKGKFVSRGQQVGLVGRTGRAFGTHLHFEVRYNRVAVDPMSYLRGQYALNARR